MKHYLTALLFTFSLCLFSQQEYHFGELTTKDKEFTLYKKDSTASAVILYHEGNTEFFEKGEEIYIRTKIYKKVKILNKDGFDLADVEISIQNSKRNDMEETVENIKGITHNDGSSTHLSKKDIYTERVTDYLQEVKFALPNIKKGSIIEYSYDLVSPYLFNFTGWDFQDRVPTLESVFKAKIPGNYRYNRSLIGYERLVVNTSTVERNCFSISFSSNKASCEVLTYTMKNIPAFIPEDYMTSTRNYKSRIKFELSEYHSFNGYKKKYSKTWKSVDREFKQDEDIGGQTRKKSFFKKRLPSNILEDVNELERAKKVYNFIKHHYTWNKSFRMFNKISVTKAFEKKTGTVSEINLGLLNAMKAAGFDAKISLMSTRRNGFPTSNHPVITDFNYILVHTTIEGKEYLLDATNKDIPFGVLPFRCLNKETRVMDFKNGSYWKEIKPIENTSTKVRMMLSLNEDEEFEGNMRVIYSGYDAIDARDEVKNVKEEKYLENLENDSEGLIIDDYSNTDLLKIDKSFVETFQVKFENDENTATRFILNPFFIEKLEENPFKLNERKYPVNFGYPFKKEYSATISLPDNFTIESMPSNKLIKLPNNAGKALYSFKQKGNNISVYFTLFINQVVFNSNDYLYLKEFFNQAIIAQSEPIILKKN